MTNCKDQKGCPALGQLFNHNGLFAADLFCCTVWLLFAFHFGFVSGRWTLMPFLIALFRLAVSVNLFRRRKKTIFPILLLLTVGVCDMIGVFSFAAPIGLSFLYIADYAARSVVDYGIYYWPLYDIFTNHNLGKTILCVILLGWMWVAVLPAMCYGIMAYRKRLRKDAGDWKGWLVGFVGTIIMLCLGDTHLSYHNTFHFAYLLLILTIPLLVRRLYLIFRDPVGKRYGAFLLVLAIAYISGYTMNKVTAWLCVPLASALFYWLVNKSVKRKGISREMYFIVCGAGFFVLATYTLGLVKLAILFLSASIIAWTCWKFFCATQRPILATFTSIACAIVLPSIAIGYNQYRAWNTKCIGVCNEVDDISTGVMYVVDEHEGYGLRDRYGLIVPPYNNELSSKNTNIEPLNRHYTYFSVSGEKGTYIVDIRTKMGKLVTKENAKLFPMGERMYNAVRRSNIPAEEWSSGSSCAYVLLPYSSYRYDKIVVSDHVLDETIDNEYYIACEQQPIGAMRFCSIITKDNAAQRVASLINYPLYRPYPIPVIKDTTEFIKQFDTIFDGHLKEVIINSKVEDWKVYKLGFNCYGCRIDTLGRSVIYNNGRITIAGLSEAEMPNLESLRKQEIASLPAEYRDNKWIPEACYVSADDEWIVRVDSDKTFKQGSNAYPYRVMVYSSKSKLTDNPQYTFYVAKHYDKEEHTNYYSSNGEDYNFYLKMDNLYDGWEYREMYMEIAGESSVSTTLEPSNWLELLNAKPSKK